MKHYLYRHIRLDKNVPFYVGIGTKSNRNHPNINSEYRRAYSLADRTNFWRKIANKTKYRIEIVLEDDDYDFIKQKEIEFIKLYGRIDLKTGTLCNLTDGGEGTVGYIQPKEKIEKLRLFMTGRKQSAEQIKNRILSREGYIHTEETKDKISNSHKGKRIDKEHFAKLVKGQLLANSKPVLQYDLEGKLIKEWESATVASRHIKVHPIAVRHCVEKKVNHAGHFIWIDKIKDEPVQQKIEVSDKIKALKKWWDTKNRLALGIDINIRKIKMINTVNGEEKIYNKILDCSIENAITSQYICKLLKSEKLYNNTFLFKYVSENKTQISYK